MSKNGSKELQQFLDDPRPELIEVIVGEIEGRMVELMVNSYGNYFSQKLLMVLDSNQKHRLLSDVVQNFDRISCDHRGTHAMQSFVDSVTTDAQENLLIDALQDRVLQLSLHAHATFVL